jgi:hypothetical protein
MPDPTPHNNNPPRLNPAAAREGPRPLTHYSICLVQWSLSGHHFATSETTSVAITRWCKGCTGRLFPLTSAVNLPICSAERWMGDFITIHLTPSEQGGAVRTSKCQLTIAAGQFAKGIER